MLPEHDTHHAKGIPLRQADGSPPSRLDAAIDLRWTSDVPDIDLPRPCAVVTSRRWRKHRVILSGLIS